MLSSERLLTLAVEVLNERAEAVADAQWDADAHARLMGMGNG